MPLLPLTIRQRLPLFISLSALLILLLEGYFIYEFSVRFCEQEFRERIQARLTEADALIATNRQRPLLAINELPTGDLPEEKIFYAADPRQVVLLNGNQLLSQVVDTSQFHTCTFCFAHIGQRDYGIHHDSLTHSTLVVSAIDRYGQSRLLNLRIGIILGIIIGVLLLTLASWFWVKKMLQPVADKIKKARVIGAKSLNLRLNVKNNHDELGQLALTFNEMLDRIEQGFHTQQQFIRNASHEIRTPLTAITTETDLALQQDRSPKIYQQALENVRTHAESLNELVTQLLLMAKVETNMNLPEQPPVAADEVLLLAFKTLQAKYPLAGQLIHLQMEATDASEFLVRCDSTLLQAAFFNLLDNAIKYGLNQPVSVRLFVMGQAICLEVIDRGPGILAKELKQVFEPFYRTENNGHISGSGIGLSLVKSIAEKYGGSIVLVSQTGEGTKAQFTLPAWKRSDKA